MRTRFKKVWCGSCSSMQFAGECPHGLVVDERPRPAGWAAEHLGIMASDIDGRRRGAEVGPALEPTPALRQ